MQARLREMKLSKAQGMTGLTTGISLAAAGAPGGGAAGAPWGVGGRAAPRPEFSTAADRNRRRYLRPQLFAVSWASNARSGKRVRPAQVSARRARALRAFGDQRQESDAAVGRPAQERRHRGIVGLCHRRREKIKAISPRFAGTHREKSAPARDAETASENRAVARHKPY